MKNSKECDFGSKSSLKLMDKEDSSKKKNGMGASKKLSASPPNTKSKSNKINGKTNKY